MVKKTKKKEAILVFPKIHSRFNDEKVETALMNKAKELLGTDEQDLNFILLSGQFYDTRGWAYSALRSWRGAIKPSSSKKKPLLDATFACLSVYLSSLISFQADFAFAYDEIKDILVKEERDDLWAIIEEKLPFVSLPPAEMFPPGLKSPIAPYYTLRQDEDIFLGELYGSVFLSNFVSNLKSRFFVYFNFEGNSAFGYFNQLPPTKNFGFGKTPKTFDDEPTTENIVRFINEEVDNLKDLLGVLISCHNTSVLEQYLVDDYETFLNKLLEIEEIDEGEG
ncbi:hypothetical protein NEF87_004038 [Candidatus Lokiarchaeum ossiferum]|uniref:Uncharacterized protein n=1 Tax=Candidatus Lokiarchaeum ossiferum TaxID=2951803 RepID=A0ABY6HW53_9ARCH|nr:hypothetical protein NEF87_004038 [Candidatus Lokiarchaeum sp. B-35]